MDALHFSSSFRILRNCSPLRCSIHAHTQDQAHKMAYDNNGGFAFRNCANQMPKPGFGRELMAECMNAYIGYRYTRVTMDLQIGRMRNIAAAHVRLCADSWPGKAVQNYENITLIKNSRSLV